jgi:hypothetical protein
VRIEQSDVSKLGDDDLRALVLALESGVETASAGLAAIYRTLARSLRRVLADRLRAIAVAELDWLNDPDAEGEHVKPGDDPVGEALAALRQDEPDGSVP